MKDFKLMSKEQYVSWHKEKYFRYKETKNQIVDINVLSDLIRQWEFDYEMDKLN